MKTTCYKDGNSTVAVSKQYMGAFKVLKASVNIDDKREVFRESF